MFSTSDHTRSKCFCEVMNSWAEWMTNFSFQVKIAVSSTASRIAPFPFWRGTLTPTSFSPTAVGLHPERTSTTMRCQGSSSSPTSSAISKTSSASDVSRPRVKLNPRGSAGDDYHWREVLLLAGPTVTARVLRARVVDPVAVVVAQIPRLARLDLLTAPRAPHHPRSNRRGEVFLRTCRAPPLTRSASSCAASMSSATLASIGSEPQCPANVGGNGKRSTVDGRHSVEVR